MGDGNSILWLFKIVFIIGVNWGIGLVFVKWFLSFCYFLEYVFVIYWILEIVLELKLFSEVNMNFYMLELDVNNIESFDKVVLEVDSKLENCGLDLLINNVGIMDRSKLDVVIVEGMI